MPQPTRFHDRLSGRAAIVTGAGTEGESRFIPGALLPVDGGANEVGTLCAYALMSEG